MPKILGLDIGEKRIGVAISDGLGLLAHPLKTLAWSGPDDLIKQLQELIEQHQVQALVAGIPLTMKGTDSKKTREVKQIVALMKSHLNITVIEVDERFTTKMAEQSLRAVGKKPSRHRDKIDQIAAVHILQIYLDQRGFNPH